MILNDHDFAYLSEQAKQAAIQAGRIIADFSKKKVEVITKTGGDTLASQVVTEVDYLSQKCILDILLPTCQLYDLGLLTEETPDDYSRFNKDYFWCIDPLDGTLPFIESKPGYSVSIALVSVTGFPVIGVIYDPDTKKVYHSIHNQGGFINDSPLHSEVNNETFNQPLYWMMDRSFHKHPLFDLTRQFLEKMAQKYANGRLEIIDYGGAAMNACWILEKSSGCYFKYPKAETGGGSIWDFSASACLFKETSASISDIYGNELNLNTPNSTFMNQSGVIFASNKDLAKKIISFYQHHTSN